MVDKEKAKRGAPAFGWTPELEEEICNYLANHSDSMMQACEKHPHWPARDSIYQHANDSPSFSDMFLSAKKRQAIVYVDEIFDNIKKCETESANIAKLKIEIDHKRWYASRLVPRLFGDRSQQEEDTAAKDAMIAKLLLDVERLKKEREKDY